MQSSSRMKIKAKMQGKSTGELFAIWKNNDRDIYSVDAFLAIADILKERGVGIPVQGVADLKALTEQPRQKRRLWPYFVGILGVLIIIAALSNSEDISSTATKTTDSQNPVPFAAPALQEPQLELVIWNWSSGYEYAKAEGQVKNISDKSLESVQAVVSWYTDAEEFITSDIGMVGYNPLLPGQTSPFKVMAKHHPAMKKASIEFKKMFGGQIFHRTRNLK
jgi:hypothetical protein